MQELREAADTGTTLADRRRPGRLPVVSPSLLPLLRADERALLPPLAEDEGWYGALGDRRLDAGQGLVLGVGLGALLWAAIFAVA